MACTPVAATTVVSVPTASGVTTEFAPIPGILIAGARADVDAAADTEVVATDATITELEADTTAGVDAAACAEVVAAAVTTTVLEDDTITTDTVAEAAGAVVEAVVVP